MSDTDWLFTFHRRRLIIGNILVTYDHGNKKKITLECLGINVLSKTPVLHGRQYLFSEMELELRLLYNKAQNHYQLPAGGGFPRNIAGTAPAVTEGALRYWLARPRGKLTVDWGGAGNLVVTPLVVNGEYDSDYGPNTARLNIEEAVGVDGTFFINWAIKARVLESNIWANDPSAMLSHNFRQTDEMTGGEGAYFNVRTTEGECYFAADMLTKLNREPDQYRSFIKVPLLKGYRREVVKVAVDEQKNFLKYLVVDRECPVSIIYPNVTNIECDIWSELDDAGEDWRNIAMGEAGVKAASGSGSIIPGWNLAVKALQAGGAGYWARLKLMPSTSHGMRLKIWGNYRSTRRELFEVANRFLRFSGNFKFIQNAGLQARIGASMMERRVDVDILYKGGPMGTPVAGLDTVTGVINNFPRGEEIKTVLSRAPQTGPQPPNDSGMRNRDLSILITPTLHEVGGPPDPHQVPPNVVPAVP